MTPEERERRLEELRVEYRQATTPADKKVIEIRGKLLKMGEDEAERIMRHILSVDND